MSKEDAAIIPVYLNQRVVFDLLAMLQDGLSQVARVTTVESDKDLTSRDIGATFGVPQALASLLRIDLSAKRNTQTEAAAELTKNEERVHTSASLLFKLRQMLRERGQIKVGSDDAAFGARDLIEFTTTLRRNPVIQAMDSLIAAVEMWAMFTEEQEESPKPKHPPKRPSQSQPEKLRSQMISFRQALLTGSTVDIVSERLGSGHAGVITLEEQFLSDPTMSNLVEGEFVVLGKVIRVVGEGESISLLRKTAMSVLPDEIIAPALAHFQIAGWNMPEIEWRIQGPALHVLPVAIFA